MTFEDLHFPEIVEFQMQQTIIDFNSRPSISINVLEYVIDEIGDILTSPLEIVYNE